MSDKTPQRPGQNGQRTTPPDRFQPKMLLIWLALLVGMILLWRFTDTDSGREQLQHAEVVAKTDQDAEDGKDTSLLREVVMRPDPGNGLNFFLLEGKYLKSLDEGADQIPFSSKGTLTESQLEALVNDANVRQEETNTWLQQLLVGLLPFLIIILLLYFLFIRQLRMAGRGAMSFGKSKAKMLTRDRDRVTFKDVAGCDEAKEEVAEIVEFLKDPKKFQRIGGRVPKGVLMVGPPGTGKTLLAKAVAGEADVPFFSISGSDFVEMFVGVGAARVRDMFEQGRKAAPCIVFIDEIDAVGRQRGAGLGGGNDEREQTLNSLLVEMDGFDGHEGVIIIAATNRPDVLDQALLRPGRFDRQVMIDLPDLPGREQILKVHAKKIKLGADVDLGVIAQGASGFSGADLANLVNEAALIAARFGKNEVSMVDFDDARDKLSFGRERRKLMDEDDKKMTAYHEAGHALVQALIGDKVLRLHKVSIIPRGRALGMTMFTPTKDILGQSRKQLIDQIAVLMAGRLGEEVVTGDYSNGAANDIKRATDIARHMVCDWGMSELGPVALGENQDHIFLGKEITRNQNYSESTARQIDEQIQRLIREQYDRAETMIQERKEALETIAQALLEHETIEGRHVHEILEHGEIRSPVVSNLQAAAMAAQESKDDEKTSKARDAEEGLGPDTAPAGAPA
ncbi:MAG: ATP-dependent zinc metalloprotease FtsH [Opitutales bacterium]